MELRSYIRILRKGWKLIALLAIVGLGLGVTATVTATPTYVASTEVFVSVQSAGSSSATDLVQGSSAAQQKVRSYVGIVGSSRVLAPVIEKLGLKTTPGALAAHVSASSPLNEVLIDITVRDVSPAQAAAIANAISESLAQVVDTLEQPATGGPSLVKVETIEPATAPSAASTPNSKLDVGLGLLLGLALGVAAALARGVLDTRLHGAHDVEALTDAPVLGGVSFDPDATKRPLIVHADPRNARAESFRALRTNLQFVGLESSSRSLVVTSSLPGEGKTTSTANLAIALAESGATVALVDGDLRLPRIAATMGLEGAVGLTDVLIGKAELIDVLQPWGRGKLVVLPAGQVPPNPSELLGSKAMASLLATLSASFDYVLVDAPPLLPVTDAAILSKLTGGALVVAAAGRTTKQQLASALHSLDAIGSRVLGVVLTMLPTKGPDAYGYGTYSSYYGPDRGAKEAVVPATSLPRSVAKAHASAHAATHAVDARAAAPHAADAQAAPATSEKKA